MDSLKTQIANITSRVTEIDGAITGLTQLIGSLIAEANKRGYELDKSNEISRKKRRRVPLEQSLPCSSVSLPVVTCPTISKLNRSHESRLYGSDSDDEFSESYSVSSDERSGSRKFIDLPRGSELREIELLNSDFFRMSSGELFEDDVSIEFDDFLRLPVGQTPETNIPVIEVKSESYPLSSIPQEAIFQAIDASTVTSPLVQLPLTFSKPSDVADILQFLSPDMQDRFIDKLAESVGNNFTKLLATNIIPAAPAVIIPIAPAMSMNNYSPQFLQQIQSQQDQTAFHLLRESATGSNNGNYYKSFGTITPSMALPFASAALCSLIAVHCSGSNANSATCLAVKAATTAAGITCNNGVCVSNYSPSANV